jgi:hypothetical protein
VFENRVLRRTPGPEGVEVTADWRKLQNEELLILYSSPNIVRMIKSKRTRWATNVEQMGGKKNHTFLWENLKEKNLLEDLGFDGKIY